jgi:hypothetical protein
MRAFVAGLAVVVALGVAPAPAAGTASAAEPRKIVIGAYINHVYGLDIKNAQFTADFNIWFRWEGDDLKPLESFELPNGRITSKTGVVKKKLGNESYASARIVAQFTKFWDLRRFPLDGHELEIEIEDAEQEDRAVVYEIDRANTSISPDLQVPGWRVRKSAATLERHVYHTNYGDTSLPSGNESSYSRFRFAIDVVRPGYGRFLKVFFGLFISVLVSWCGFFVRPKESSPRVSLGVGATFAAAAVTVAINNSLPDTNAVTMADKLIMLTLGIILASLVETITALILFAKDKVVIQQRLDRTCQILFPATYVALLIAILT